MNALDLTNADTAQLQPVSAAQRLAESRERMRQYMLRGEGRHEARRRRDTAHAQGLHSSMFDRLRAMPGVGLVIDAVAAWWSNHPLHPMVRVADSLVRETAVPLARKHPFLLIAAAFAGGIALVRFKPWRRLRKSMIFAGLFSQITTHLITQMPWEAVLDAVTSLARKQPRSSHEAPTPSPAGEPAASEEMVGMKEAA